MIQSGCNFHSKEVEKEIARLYVEENMHAEELKMRFGYKTRKSITDKVKKYYPDFDFKQKQRERKPYYGLSFKKINDPFVAYFIGLLVTDGYVQSNRPQIGIDMTDEDVISFLAKQFNFKYHTYASSELNKKDRHRIIFEGQEYVDQLKRFSIVPKKSRIIKGLELTDEEWIYFPYILRGIIDGDGCFSHRTKDGATFLTITTASEEFALWLKDTLEKRMFMRDINIYTREEDGLKTVSTSNKRNMEIIKTLCYYEKFGMTRKYNIIHGQASETIMETP